MPDFPAAGVVPLQPSTLCSETPCFPLRNRSAGTRVVTLINISVGWRIPFGAHLAVQTATLALLMCSAVHPYCDSVVSWSGWGGVERRRRSGSS